MARHGSVSALAVRKAAAATTGGRAVRIIGYVRVSTGEQADSGAGLQAQRQAIETACETRGFMLVDVIEDAGASGKTLSRPGLDRALAHIKESHADGIMVSKLDRLSRSVVDFNNLLDKARKGGWKVIVLDADVDTTTPMGEAMANMVAVFAQLERRMIGQRTKDALAVKRAQGVVLGRPRVIDETLRERVREMRQGDLSFRSIADALAAEGVPTGHGGVWHPSTVAGLVKT